MSCQENKQGTSMAHVACESKLRSVVDHTCIHAKEKCVAIGSAVVYSARAAHIFSAGIKCRHCRICTVVFLITSLLSSAAALAIGSCPH